MVERRNSTCSRSSVASWCGDALDDGVGEGDLGAPGDCAGAGAGVGRGQAGSGADVGVEARFEVFEVEGEVEHVDGRWGGGGGRCERAQAVGASGESDSRGCGYARDAEGGDETAAVEPGDGAEEFLFLGELGFGDVFAGGEERSVMELRHVCCLRGEWRDLLKRAAVSGECRPCGAAIRWT